MLYFNVKAFVSSVKSNGGSSRLFPECGAYESREPPGGVAISNSSHIDPKVGCLGILPQVRIPGTQPPQRQSRSAAITVTNGLAVRKRYFRSRRSPPAPQPPWALRNCTTLSAPAPPSRVYTGVDCNRPRENETSTNFPFIEL